MKTTHKIYFESAKSMSVIPSSSVHLVVTSPAYPMIQMWDDMFADQDREVGAALRNEKPLQAFELMHRQLDPVWGEIYRILIDGGLACINIGDAVRTVDEDFRLYPNHARIMSAMGTAGFSALPLILWRKPTNAPNKFMGSGMLPASAYVTLEHEYILIFRKGSKRGFHTPEDKQLRRESAFFWEERNAWFSDIWLGLIGTVQKMKNAHTRLRSAAFPFELAYRLINMYSLKGDTVVDPFLGTGTTLFAAMASARNCMGFEIDAGFKADISSQKNTIVAAANGRLHRRIQDHLEFVKTRSEEKSPPAHRNKHYKFPVMSRQEGELFFNPLENVRQPDENSLEVRYADIPAADFPGDWNQLLPARPEN
jgi:DNA modification methylase